jgi:pimeloyl-ACP methyl ester carboxylesterase
MTSEDMERVIEFVIKRQAQFTTDFGRVENRLETVVNVLAQVADNQLKMAEGQARSDSRIAELAEAQKHTNESLVARSYAQPGAMRAGFEVFRNFEQDAKDFAQFAETKLTMPMLVLTGEKASGEFLIAQARLVDTNVDGVVIKGKGHWLMEEAPSQSFRNSSRLLTSRIQAH